MIRNDAQVVVERSGNFDESSFGIDSNDVSLILEIIRNKLYTNKMGSFVREITSNAYDAMIEASIISNESVDAVRSRYIEIRLPSEDNNNTLTIRDFGTGMSDDKVKKIYTRVGKSTRSNSNKFVGMMGIGRLVGFCLTDSFNVVSFVDGVRTEYLCYIDETKCGKVAMLSQAETQEPNGIAISVNVPSEERSNLEQELRLFTSFVDDVKFKFIKPDGYRFRSLISTDDATVSIIRKGANWVKYTDRLSENGGVSAYIKMGIVKYPIPSNLIDSRFFYNGTTIFTVPIGAVTVSASREGLELTPDTIAYVKNLFENAKQESAVDIFSTIATAPTLSEAIQRFVKYDEVWESLDRPKVEYTHPTTKKVLNIADLSRADYGWCTYTPNTVCVLDANGKLTYNAQGENIVKVELDANNLPVLQEIKNKRQTYELRQYVILRDKRLKVDDRRGRRISFELRSPVKTYFRIVDDQDVESLPDIRRCRTLFKANIATSVYVFTRRGLAHFIDLEGYDPTEEMVRFDDLTETVLPRGSVTRPPAMIKTVAYKYDISTNTVTTEVKSDTVELDNLSPGYWVSRHYSNIMYSRKFANSIDEMELNDMFTAITAFLKHNINLYIMPAGCGRILDTAADDYPDLVPVYVCVDNLLKTTDFPKFIHNHSTDISIPSWNISDVTNICASDIVIKSTKTTELFNLIKCSLRPYIPGEIHVPNHVIFKLREFHKIDNVSITNFSQTLHTYSSGLSREFPLMPSVINNFSTIKDFVEDISKYDEYMYAVEQVRLKDIQYTEEKG